MRCPYCSSDDDRVMDSRSAEGGAAIRRRRECRACGQRFSTYERPDQFPLTVRKHAGVEEPFDRRKLLAGIEKATANLSLPSDAALRTAAQVEVRIRGLGRREVSSEQIGAEVLAALRELHQVAYVRFASVYKGFTSPEDFVRELADLEQRTSDPQ
ncbi:MAG: transcriptional regulator NrdR [Egibacteraceae bacterium]